MVPGVGVVGPAGSALPSEFSELLPPRYVLGCDGMPNISVGAGGVCATAVPTKPTVAALASSNFRILSSSLPGRAGYRSPGKQPHICRDMPDLMSEYGQEFSEAAICDRPSRKETCAIVEHL